MMTVIELSEADIVKFKLFMEHYELFSLLLTTGVFNQKRATINLNFNHNGELMSIQRADFLYSNKHDKLEKA